MISLNNYLHDIKFRTPDTQCPFCDKKIESSFVCKDCWISNDLQSLREEIHQQHAGTAGSIECHLSIGRAVYNMAFELRVSDTFEDEILDD